MFKGKRRRNVGNEMIFRSNILNITSRRKSRKCNINAEINVKQSMVTSNRELNSSKDSIT